MRFLKSFLIILMTFMPLLSEAKGLTNLMKAASEGKLASVKKLVKTQDVNARDEEKQTALYYALINSHTDTALFLIDKNADLKNLNDREDSALTIATSLNNHKVMVALLKKDPALINKVSLSGKSPLMEAARFGNRQTVEILLGSKADLTLKNQNGQTAIDIAKKAQNKTSIELIQAAEK